MISNGLEEEALKLHKYSNLNTLNTVGYKEFFDYFKDKLSYDGAIDKIKQNTRNYAKRQITWLKKFDLDETFFSDDNDKVMKILSIIKNWIPLLQLTT